MSGVSTIPAFSELGTFLRRRSGAGWAPVAEAVFSSAMMQLWEVAQMSFGKRRISKKGGGQRGKAYSTKERQVDYR